MKIDITKMEGYREDMTAEEKLALYSSYEFTPDYTGYVKKDVFDKKPPRPPSCRGTLNPIRRRK